MRLDLAVRTPRPDSCADRLFWKNLLVNVIFVLGIPSALTLKLRSMLGRTAEWKTLAQANSFARRGAAKEALPLYDTLLTQWPDHPGLLFNQAMARAISGDLTGALEGCRRTRLSCANYEPAQRLKNGIDEAARTAGTGPAAPIGPALRSDNPLTTHV